MLASMFEHSSSVEKIFRTGCPELLAETKQKTPNGSVRRKFHHINPVALELTSTSFGGQTPPACFWG